MHKIIHNNCIFVLENLYIFNSRDGVNKIFSDNTRLYDAAIIMPEKVYKTHKIFLLLLIKK